MNIISAPLGCLLAAHLLCLSFATAAEDAEPAYEWGAALTLESIANLDGGLERDTREMSNLDLTLAIDTNAAGWWDSGELFIYVLGNYGRDASELVGDVQGISNIATDNAIKVYELWYRHGFMRDSLQILLGLHDYNASFYSLDSAAIFNHPSFGIGPDTSQVGPSIFATTATTLQLRWQGANQYVQAAVYDGVPGDPENPRGTHIRFDEGDGVFAALELGLFTEGSYKFALGGWQHSAERDNPVTGELIDDNRGGYLIAEKLWADLVVADNLAIFLQVGEADDQRNQLQNYYGGGITLGGFWRAGDGLGLAFAQGRNGSPYLLANPEQERAETAWELTYITPLWDFLSLQASLYYIHNPGMDKQLNDALALGTRAYIEF